MVTVLFITGAIAMWAHLCFKARATQRQANTKSVTVERNSQVIYKSIPEGISGTVVPPNHTELVQHTNIPEMSNKGRRLLHHQTIPALSMNLFI